LDDANEEKAARHHHHLLHAAVRHATSWSSWRELQFSVMNDALTGLKLLPSGNRILRLGWAQGAEILFPLGEHLVALYCNYCLKGKNVSNYFKMSQTILSQAISSARLVQNSSRNMFPGCPKPVKTPQFMAFFQHAFLR
jgi:hypothetical protein